MRDGATLGQTPADLARELLSFSQAPGKYALRLGEPKSLFNRLDTVAQWAAGRLPAELTPQVSQLTAAAVLFIQRACFTPGNTHYQILGLTASTLTPELLRTRYRSLIRLTHPDMGIAGLPPDAAGMVNRALDVLSDDAARQRYDDQLKKAKPRAHPHRQALRTPQAPPSRGPQPPPAHMQPPPTHGVAWLPPPFPARAAWANAGWASCPNTPGKCTGHW
ncbi:J domain-containing protein [Ottowia caeni]|uniref:J domain-containing protein n=1 Tax=Ottowia caeni TaxID=2870339 RepID=UPI003D73E8EE